MNNEQKQAGENPSFVLLDEVKQALAITWDDEDKNLMPLIDKSIYAVNDLVGVKLDLDVNKLAREMVIQRIRYEYNNALDEFEDNYSKPLSRLILNIAIEEGKKENGYRET